MHNVVLGCCRDPEQKELLSFQRRIYFRIRNKELQLYLSVPDDVEDMKAGRVVVSSLSEQSNSVWYYEDGLLKNQVRMGCSKTEVCSLELERTWECPKATL